MKIKKIMIQYENGSWKGYNLSGFLAVFQVRLIEWLKQRGVYVV